MKTFITAVAAATVVMAGCAGEDSNKELQSAIDDANAAMAAGNGVVSFELADIEGVRRQSSEWDGQPKLLNFWATWCAPCRREIPLLKATQTRYADIDLQVIGIAVDFQEEVVRYAEETGFNYPILIGQEDAMAVAESSGVEFIGLPFTMVVAASGELIKTHIGEIEEEHIARIAGVLTEMQQGALDLAGARERLGKL